MTDENGSREEVPPMTAELVEDVTLRMPVGRDWTFDDLLRLPRDGRRYEIVDGSLHVSPAPALKHQRVAHRLTDVLKDAAPADLQVIPAVGVVCGRHTPVPDVVVGLKALPEGAMHFLPPQVRLVVEVMSPGSVFADRVFKPAMFAAAGIPAFWRVELDGPGTPLIIVHVLRGDVYREVVTVRAGESVTVDVPFRVELRPADWIEP
jgi:Uma2 family endonuclease